MEVSITGAKIYYVIPGINYPITQTVVNAWIAMVVIVGLCIWLTRGMQVHARTKRQVVAEMLVQMAQKLVRGNMGAKWDSFVPFIAAILSMSVVSSLMGLTGAYSPTNDLNIPCLGYSGVCPHHIPQNQGEWLRRLSQELHGTDCRHDADEHHQRDRNAGLDVTASFC